MCSFIIKSFCDWDSKFSIAEFSYNQTPSYATKYSPFEVMYDVNPFVPLELSSVSREVYLHVDAKLKEELMMQVHQEVWRNIEKANANYNLRNNKGKVRDMVWVHPSKERFLANARTNECI